MHSSSNYVKQCALCSTHKGKSKQSPSRPIVSTNFLTRVQVDLTYMGSVPDGVYKWICHARDHFTKFSWTGPLKSKSTTEVAKFLYNIFIVFGAPIILQTDNGTEFTSSVIAELMSLWPRTKIIRGRPRHPQSQGAVERANAVLKNKLATWMEVNRSKHWTKGLPLVTHAMNLSVCRATNRTPYELVFNQRPRSHYALLDELADDVIVAEEDLNINFEEDLNINVEEGSYSILHQQENNDTDNLEERVETEEDNDNEVFIVVIKIIN